MNQGACGGGWAIAAAGTSESALVLSDYSLSFLSAAHVLDCTPAEFFGAHGCKGGSIFGALEYLTSEGAYQTGDYRHFNGAEHSCMERPVERKRISSYSLVEANAQRDLKLAVA